MELNVRKAIENDIPRIMELYEELTGEKMDLPAAKARMTFHEITKVPHSELLVIENDNTVIGTLFYLRIPNLTHNARPWATIENVVVDQRYHRQGIGRKLVEYALKRCSEAGCYKVQLLSTKTRKQAHQFYRDLGFEDTAMGFRYYFQGIRD
jgi:ribosomal protein S18 acetylase RimI-like enzyme